MNTKTKPSPDAVLCKSLINLQQTLKLSQLEVGSIIGLDRSSVSRLAAKGGLDPASKQGELSLILIRIYRALFAMVGGDRDSMIHWLRTENDHVGGVPVELVKSVQGINRVAEYLDAIRGQ